MKSSFKLAAGMALTLAVGAAFAGAPNWDKVPAKKVTLFYPGTAAMEWVTKGTEHGGAKAIKKGERCLDCHEEEAADIGNKIVSGQKLEPTPIKGKAGSIPLTVQAANDGENLYVRMSFKSPPASGAAKMDADNQVKVAFMLEDGGKADLAAQGGCWGTCHADARTMPGAKDDKKTKYLNGGSVAGGKYMDIVQWQSGKKAKPVDGSVAEARNMSGGSALVSAEGKNAGGTWTVVFTRKLAGNPANGDVALAPGKQYNIGFAVHDDHAAGRFHHVSFGYTLGLDDAKANINAVKQ